MRALTAALRGKWIGCLVLTGCAGSSSGAPSSPSSSPSPRIAGWEGFYELETLGPLTLSQKEIPVELAVLRALQTRVVRLILAAGEQESTQTDLDASFAQYCGRPDDRAWNEDRCAAYQARRCSDGTCQYQHFGSCSGFLLGDGLLVTAGHCVAPLAEDASLRVRSKILIPGADGRLARESPVEIHRLLKKHYSHDWVVKDEVQPMDVALLRIDDGGLRPYPLGPVPAPGGVVFVVGYPRVEGRSERARAAIGYRSVPGRLSVSFGRVDDDNPATWPFCSTDGRQEGWRLASSCPLAAPDAQHEAWRGVISAQNFTTTMDTINGYSGAPVFDAAGTLVGINSTVAGGVDPRQAYAPGLRAVVTKAKAALDPR